MMMHVAWSVALHTMSFAISGAAPNKVNTLKVNLAPGDGPSTPSENVFEVSG